MTREEFVESLVAMYQGQPGAASLDNPLCDSLITRGARFAVFPPKATIAAKLAKLCGWDAPTKVEVEAGTQLATFLGGLFASGGTLGGSNQGNGENGERNNIKEASSNSTGPRR
jgi:hypothetical protein